jgi:hypothetical protein
MGTTKTKQWLFFVLLLILSCYRACFSIAGNTLSAGQSLSFSKNESILSQGGTFELGFFTPSSSVKIYLGIWHKWFVPKEAVWVANRENPLSDPTSSRLDLSEDGNLLLFEGSSKIPFWSTNLTFPGSNITEAILRDDGNFVLRNRSNRSSIFWESFNHPTDTWLPGAKLGVDKLISWKNSEDPAPGVFSFGLDPNGSNQSFLEWNRSQIYWSTGVWNGETHTFAFVPEMTLNDLFNYSFVSNENGRYLTYSFYNLSFRSKFVMRSTGNIQQLLWLSGPLVWNSFWSVPRDQSDVYALCGGFGVYSGNSSSPCECLKGFEPISTNYTSRKDWSGGCVRKFPLQCENITYANGKKDWFTKIPFLRLPVNSKAYSAASVRNCEVACMNNCSCTAYAYNSSGYCVIWEGALLNLQQLSGGGEIMYLRLAADEHQSTKGELKNLHKFMSSFVRNVLILHSLLYMVELIVILVIIIRQKMESMGRCASSNNRTYLMSLHLFFNQRKAQTHR